jgi:hypothetical protein
MLRMDFRLIHVANMMDRQQSLAHSDRNGVSCLPKAEENSSLILGVRQMDWLP